MSARSRLALAFAMLLLPQVRLLADVAITETTVRKAGDRSAQGTRFIYIKGAQMRIDFTQANDSVSSLYDLGLESSRSLMPGRSALRFATSRR